MAPPSHLLEPPVNPGRFRGVSRNFQLSEKLRLHVLAEGFNLTNHVNGITLNGVFGTGTYPNNPSPAFEQITAVGDPRTFQFGLRASF